MRSKEQDDGYPQTELYEKFLEQFARDRERIFAYIYSLLPHLADAEDVFQRSSVVLWRKFGEFEPETNFLAWACTVAAFEVRNFLKTAQRDRLQFDQELINQLAANRIKALPYSEDRLSALQGCLQELSRDQRKLVDTAYGNESSIKDLAETTGRASQTLYNQLGKLRRQLLNCVQRKLAAQG